MRKAADLPGLFSSRIASLSRADARKRIVSALKRAEYKQVCLDLKGYRTGAKNEVFVLVNGDRL